MKKITVVFILVAATLIAAGCQTAATTPAPTQTARVEMVVVTATPATEIVEQVVTPEPTTQPVVLMVGVEGLSSPKLHHAGEHPAGESSVGFFDIGVNEGQYGLVFGWNLAWGAQSIPGEGCELVVLVPGWYEDFEITDGRYEVYDLPAADPSGWAEVLLSQRIEEQAAHYGCPADADPPVWDGE